MLLDVFNSEKLLRGLGLGCPEESFMWVIKTQRQPTVTSTAMLLCKDWTKHYLVLAAIALFVLGTPASKPITKSTSTPRAQFSCQLLLNNALNISHSIFFLFLLPFFFPPAWDCKVQFLQILMPMTSWLQCLHAAASKTWWTEYQWKVDTKGVITAQANSCKNVNEYSWHFCGIQPSPVFWTSPISIAAGCGEGEKLRSSHRSYQPFTAKLGPT